MSWNICQTMDYKRRIRRGVRLYIAGSVLFALVAVASVLLGVMVLDKVHFDLPAQCMIFSLAGVILLWEMARALRFKAELPDDFKPMDRNEFPELFVLLDEVTDTLHLSPVSRVYVSDGVEAAVFVRPTLRNLYRRPQRNLVLGLALLTQLNDDELRAVLYHEFGHYVQDEINDSSYVYIVGQLSRSFVAIRNPEERMTIWKLQTRSQQMLFSYFSLWICERINRAYAGLSRQMEYAADDVAAAHVGKAVLCRALAHASAMRYNYDFARCGISCLERYGVGVRKDSLYQALSILSEDVEMPAAVRGRLDRLGADAIWHQSASSAGNDTVRTAVLRAMMDMPDAGKDDLEMCPAERFSAWLAEGAAVYREMQMLAKSVLVEVHLDRRRHTLPYVEGKYAILLDGRKVGVGNFIKGYTLRFRTSPGRHVLSAYAFGGILTVPFEFETARGGSYRVEMDYKYVFRATAYRVFVESITRVA